MHRSGKWRSWRFGKAHGYELSVGDTFHGDVSAEADGSWKASLNGRPLGGYGARDAAFDRVEREIAGLLKRALLDWLEFKPERPD